MAPQKGVDVGEEADRREIEVSIKPLISIDSTINTFLVGTLVYPTVTS